MRPITTLALFITSVVLGVVIWWSDRDSNDSGILADGYDSGQALLRLTPDTIGRMVIKRPGGDTILGKRDGYWFIESPIADRADPENLEALLDLLSHLTVLDQIPIDDVGSSDELEPEALGLTGEQVIRVELSPALSEGQTEPSGPVQVLLLGNPTPLTNSIYARIPESEERPDVYVVDGNPRKYLDDPVTALRDRHLFLAPSEQIVQVTVKTPRGDIEIKRKITPPEVAWSLTKPLQTRADRDRVDHLLGTLASLRVDQIIASGELPGPPPNPVPDGSVVLELRRYGVETPLTIHLSPVRDQPEDAATRGPAIEARVSDRPAVFQLRSDLLATLPSSTNAFRDPHLASIPLQSVFGLGIESRGNPPVILKTARSQEGVKWFSERNGVGEPANVMQIVELIQAINEEKVINFVSDSADQLASYNLSPPAVQIAISHYERLPETAPDGAPAGSGGKLGITKKVLQLGYQEVGDEGTGVHKLFANFVGEPYIYEISPTFREKVPTNPLKWKDLKLMSFNPISFRSVSRQRGEEESIILTYDYRRDQWGGTMGAEKIDDRINRDAARKLRDALGSLTCNRWLTPSPQAYQSLETPDAVFEITLEMVDRATGTAGPKTHVLKFAKATELNYYGRIDDLPEIFEIDRDVFRDLVTPVLTTRVLPPE